MRPLPPALRNPKDGRYSVDDAVRVWLHSYHGLSFDTPARDQGSDYDRCRRLAVLELRGIIRAADRACGFAGQPSGPLILGRIHDHWVTRADLVELAARHGIDLFPEATAATMPDKATSGPKPVKARPGAPIKIPDEAIDLVRRLYSSGEAKTKKEAGMTAAERFGLDPIRQGKTLETYIGRERKKPTQ